MTFARRDTRPRPNRRARSTDHRIRALACVLLLHVAAVAPSLACTIEREYPGVGATDPSELRLARIDGEDLLVDIDWSAGAPASMQLVLQTGAEPPETVATWGLAASPDALETVRLDAALSIVETHGFTYRLRLLDDAAEVESELDVALAVDCPADGCRYVVIDGVGGADLPRVPPSLWAVIEEALSIGVTDLFDHVESEHPELARYLPGLAWQLERAAGEPPPDAAWSTKGQGGGEPTAGCGCTWVQVASFDDMAETTFDIDGPSGSPPTHVAGTVSPGAGHLLAAQTYRTVDIPAAELHGTSVFGLVPFCVRRTGSKNLVQTTEWPSKPSLTVLTDTFEPCDAPCAPDVSYRVEASVCTLGFASAGPEATPHADAWAAGSVLLDGQMLLALNKDASAAPAAGFDATDRADDARIVSGSRATSNAVATITGTGYLDLLAAPSGYETYALGGSGFGFEMELSVPNGCPGVAAWPSPVRRVSRMKDDIGQGGAILRSWENYP